MYSETAFLSTKPMPHDERYFIEALSRGLRILEAFSEDRPTLTLVEVAKAVGLDKSTVFRFVYTLEELGYLERDPQSKRYRPGIKVLRLGFTAVNNLDISERADPHLQWLADESGEAINMAVREGSEIVYIGRISPVQIVNINLHVGSRLPVHCTSMGKIQLIDFSAEAIGGLLGAGPYEGFTAKTVTTLDALLAEVEEARAQGYAVGDEELAVGLRSIAAPIRGADDQIAAAVNVSVSSARVSRMELEEQLGPMVVEAGQRISSALGAARRENVVH